MLELLEATNHTQSYSQRQDGVVVRDCIIIILYVTTIINKDKHSFIHNSY